MKKILFLLKMNIKSSFNNISKMLTAFVFFGLLLALCGYGMMKFNESRDEEKRMKVAVVLPQQSADILNEDKYITAAFGFLQETETVKDVCEFVYMKENIALSMLSKGQLAAVIIIPERFISGIINGENNPARVIFEKNGISNTSLIFQEMIRAGAADLSSAQAGIYSVEDAIREYVKEDTQQAILDADFKLNMQYFAYALDRNIYFEQQSVQDGESVTTTQLYVTAVSILLLYMLSIVSVTQIRPESANMQLMFRKNHIPVWFSCISKIFSVSLAFFTITGAVFLISGLLVIRVPKLAQVLTMAEGFLNTDDISYGIQAVSNIITGLLGLFLLIVSVMAFSSFVLRLSDKNVTGVVLLIILVIVMMYCSGLIIPENMLPEKIGEIGKITPVYWNYRLFVQIIKGTFNKNAAIVNVIITAFFIMISSVFDYFRISK